MPLTESQKVYLAGAPPSDPGIEELVRLGHSEEFFVWGDSSKSTWRDHGKAELQAKYQFTGEWLDGPGVHYLLLGLHGRPGLVTAQPQSFLQRAR